MRQSTSINTPICKGTMLFCLMAPHEDAPRMLHTLRRGRQVWVGRRGASRGGGALLQVLLMVCQKSFELAPSFRLAIPTTLLLQQTPHANLKPRTPHPETPPPETPPPEILVLAVLSLAIVTGLRHGLVQGLGTA